MKAIKQSTLIPMLLTVYLIVMVCMFGLQHFHNGDYLFFFGIILITAIIIVLLHFLLKKKEQMRDNREK